ncbi:hypothetical protein GF327_10305 [Candidatus Woesearchaeota archaeon]|nr:hypothetical protein [Candidatus Woesearchaeota archaeon]
MKCLEKIINFSAGAILSGALFVGCTIPSKSSVPLIPKTPNKISSSEPVLKSAKNIHKSDSEKITLAQNSIDSSLFLLPEPIEPEINWKKEVFAPAEFNWAKEDLHITFSKPDLEALVQPKKEYVFPARDIYSECSSMPRPFQPESDMPKNNWPDFSSIALHLLVSASSVFAFRYLRRKKIFKKIKEAYDFLISLPELSKPGIYQNDILKFLENYAPNTAKSSLKLFAHQFMRAIPDRKQFSKLDLIVLANTLKNNFKYNDYTELGLGIYTLIKNYDRSVFSFESLLESVKNSEKNLTLPQVCENISKMLFTLNQNTNGNALFEFQKEYNTLIDAAEYECCNGRISYAENYFREAIICNPERSEAYFKLASVLILRTRKYSSIIKVYSDLISSEPCDIIKSQAYLERATQAALHQKIDTALNDLDKVRDDFIRKYQLLSWGWDGKKSKAEKFLFFCKKIYSCYMKPAFRYYNSLSLNQKNKLTGCLDNSVLITEIAQYLSERCTERKPLEQTLAECSDFLSKCNDTTNWQYWIAKAKECEEKKDYVTLVKYVGHALSLAPNNPAPYMQLAELCQRNNNLALKKKGINILSRAIQKCSFSKTQRFDILEMRSNLYQALPR